MNDPIETDLSAFMNETDRRDALMYLAAPHKYAPPALFAGTLAAIARLETIDNARNGE